MRQTHHAAVRAGLVTALSLVVTLEGMPVRALAATPTDAPSTSTAAPSSQEPSSAGATGVQSKAPAPTEKKTAASQQKGAPTVQTQQNDTAAKADATAKADAADKANKDEKTEKTEKVDTTDTTGKVSVAEKTTQTQQTTTSEKATAANQNGQANVTDALPAHTDQTADSAPADAATFATVQQDARPQSAGVSIRAVDEQGKGIDGATISVAGHAFASAAGTYDFNPGETVTVAADASTYAHVEQTFVINGSPIAITMKKSAQADAPQTPVDTKAQDQPTTVADTASQNQALVDRMAREFDASYGVINLLAYAPQYNAGVNVTSAIRQRLAANAPEGLTISVASSDESVITAGGTIGNNSDPKAEITPYKTTHSSECSFTFSLGEAHATTSVHTVQVGWWSTDKEGKRATIAMQGDVELPNTFRTGQEVPLFAPSSSSIPKEATFTWRLVSPDSAFSLKTTADNGTQMLVAHSQDHATTATLEAALVPSKTAGYDFYFYPVRSFTLRMSASAQVVAVSDPLRPTVVPRRRSRRSLQPIRQFTPTLVPAVVPAPVVPTPVVPTPLPTPSVPGSDTSASSAASPSGSPVDAAATEVASASAAASSSGVAAASGVSATVGTRGAQASSAAASKTTSNAFPSASPSSHAASPDVTSATDAVPPADGTAVNEEGFLGALRSTIVTTAPSSQNGVGMASPGAPAAPLVPLAGVAMGIACITGAAASRVRKGAKAKARK